MSFFKKSECLFNVYNEFVYMPFKKNHRKITYNFKFLCDKVHSLDSGMRQIYLLSEYLQSSDPLPRQPERNTLVYNSTIKLLTVT